MAPAIVTIAILFLCGTGAADNLAGLPDIRNVSQYLFPPPMTAGEPEPGKRVRQIADDYQGTEVYHCLYLPTEWQPGRKFPVIVEYPGNGSYKNDFGDVCTGKVEDCNLGYGVTGGSGVIWLCLPFVSEDHQRNQLKWWGDVNATVEYCKKTVAQVCHGYGGDPSALILAGFSRGAIACNYIGLHDDEIAKLWRAFIAHSHYDGVREWDYADSDRAVAAKRLARLGDRPQFISHEGSTEETRNYLETACPQGHFTFQSLPFRNHTDSWVLRNIPERKALRAWLTSIIDTR